MKLRKLFIRQSDAERPAKITWRNVLAVLQAFIRKTRSIAGFDVPIHIYEQIIWRRTQVLARSPMCWHSGSCTVCGCDILGKTMEDRACSISEHPDLMRRKQPCYPEMMDEDEWKQYKHLNKIKLFDEC